MTPHCDNDLTAWLVLHFAQASPRAWRQGLELLSSPQLICQQSPDMLQRLGFSPRARQAIYSPNHAAIAHALAWQQAAPHQHLISWSDPRYPERLRHIADPPPLLYVVGDAGLLNSAQLAMVGSRSPSPMGLRLAQRFSQQLGQAGLTITSGLALGIDVTCHQAALQQGAPTIAVLGTGVDTPYPRQNRLTFAKIAESGAIISDLPLSTQPRAAYFPQRNRLISGMSLGTLVVEASLRSGSLITARLALEQDREVFAIPSSITNPRAAGCHWLIQQGAKLVTSVADILCELPNFTTPTVAIVNEPGTALDLEQQKLLECIGYDVIKFEQLVDESGLSEQKISVLLCNLLLCGYIKEAMGGYTRVS